MTGAEYQKMLAEGKELRYHQFVSILLSEAKKVCPSVTPTQIAVAYRLKFVISGMFEWKEAEEFFERFDAEPEE